MYVVCGMWYVYVRHATPRRRRDGVPTGAQDLVPGFFFLFGQGVDVLEDRWSHPSYFPSVR
jgi:hypothetical protein